MTIKWESSDGKVKGLPGSDTAVSEGCTCPRMDNAYGAGRFGLGHDWIINTDCPLHGDNRVNRYDETRAYNVTTDYPSGPFRLPE